MRQCSGKSASVVVLVWVAVLFSGCTGKQSKPDAYAFPEGSVAAPAFNAWIDGDDASASALDDDPQTATVEALFVAGESLFWAGDMEASFDAHVQVLSRFSAHPLARFSAARLHDLHDDVIDFHERVSPMLAGITFGDVHPLTASYLSMIGQRVALTRWYRDRTAKPFDANAQGLPLRWMASPKMSPYRLVDFEQVFPPERDQSLRAAYRSPAFSDDDVSNLDDSTPFIASNINLEPELGSGGVYYLETFATVEGTEDQVYWVYSNFAGAARVWIDGQEVVERDEDDYSTGKRWRRIKLSPGEHRVLVKFAYMPNYRDWFDLTFLNKDATALAGSKLTFNERPSAGAVAGQIELLSQVHEPIELEPILVRGASALAKADDVTLYLTALAAHYDREPEVFEPAYQALVERAPKFAAVYGLKSLQARTLWEIPSKVRDSTALVQLRKAHELDPDSLYFTYRLAQWLRGRDTTREVRMLLESARDAAVVGEGAARRLRYIRPLDEWADYLESKGWDEAAETAWSASLAIAPSDCKAARSLQSLYYDRGLYLEPVKLTPSADKCPALADAWAKSQPELYDEHLRLLERTASRYPYSSSAQKSYADGLVAVGKTREATRILEQARARLPKSRVLAENQVDLMLASAGEDAALKVLDDYVARNGMRGWVVWERATLTGQTPLDDLMRDGVEVARAIAEAEPAGADKNSAQDEAFYAIDFAARHDFPDGSSVSLTHTMVRVMTKSAIDRFAEVAKPGDAKVLLARTIKQDGTTLVPEQTAGKETLSMPGLAEGDFVELAYLQYEGPNALSNTRRLGTKFFFKMAQISSLHSEYVIIDPRGEVLRRNGAPEVEPFTYNGLPAVRFKEVNSPRPRQEPYTVSAEEYLPWVQLYNQGSSVEQEELSRKRAMEVIRDNSKLSQAARQQFARWLDAAGEEQGDALVRDLFYQVTGYFTSPSSAFSSELSHGVITREGNPMLTLYVLYRQLGIDAELFLIRSKYANPNKHPMLEPEAFSEPVLRVMMPDSKQPAWLFPQSQDAMFGAMDHAYLEQPARCVTCEEPERAVLPGAEAVRLDSREMKITAKLDVNGSLSGTATQTYDGPSAVVARRVLRQRTEETERAKFIDLLLTEHIPGATSTSYKIAGAEDRGSVITFTIEFERQQFAQAGQGGLKFDGPIFRQPIASIYTTLPERTLPLFVSRARTYKDVFELELPAAMAATLRSKQGKVELDGPFGRFTREVTLEGSRLVIDSDIDMGISRVEPALYKEFQEWALATELSSRVVFELQ